VRHGADRHQAEVTRQQHVRGALEELRDLVLEGVDHLALPVERKAPAQAEVEHLEGVSPWRLVALEAAQLLDLAEQPAFAFGARGLFVEAAEVQLVDDRQHEDLEGHHVHLRAVDDDLEVATDRPGADEVALEAEDAQEVDEVVLDEPKTGQVLQLVGAEAQRAEMIELTIDVVDQLGQRKLADLAAEEGVLGLRLRKTMQHRLPHRELVEVGVQQTVDDGFHRGLAGQGFRGWSRSVWRSIKPAASVLDAVRTPLARMPARSRLVLALEAGHGAHAVGEQHHALGPAAGQIVDDMLGGGTHAVAAGLAGHQQQVGAVERIDEGAVQLRARVGRIRHLGHHRAVVLGPGVVALEHLGHAATALVLPGGAGGMHVGMHAMAPAADLAMHRPDHQRVAAAGLELVEVGQRAGKGQRVARRELASPHLCRRDRREGRDDTSACGLPEAGVRDVQPMVRVQRDGDRVQLRARLADERRQPHHVGMCPRHRQRRRQARPSDRIERPPRLGQVAEVVLRVDDQQLDAGFHGHLRA
jgi:hypothetical protein